MNEQDVIGKVMIGDKTIDVKYSMLDKKSQELIDNGFLSKGLLNAISFDGQANRFVVVGSVEKEKP